MVRTNLGPDEQIYLAQAAAFSQGRWSALRDLASEYVEEPTLHAYPSPLRWLWTALVALTLPVGPIALQIVSAIAIGPTAWLLTHSWLAAAWAATSPLVFTLARRRLQDVPVALGTLIAIFGASQHSAPLVCAALFVTLCMKESAALAVPAIAAAWIFAGASDLAQLVGSIAAAGAAWLVSLAILFGKQLPAMFRTAALGHNTKYAEQHQRGAAHRLLVDLVLTSPVAVLCAVLGSPHQPALAGAALFLLAVHAGAPIRNVRFVVAADVLLRIVGSYAMTNPIIELSTVILVDALIAHRIRNIYDPVTQALTTALGMPTFSGASSGKR